MGLLRWSERRTWDGSLRLSFPLSFSPALLKLLSALVQRFAEDALQLCERGHQLGAGLCSAGGWASAAVVVATAELEGVPVAEHRAVVIAALDGGWSCVLGAGGGDVVSDGDGEGVVGEGAAALWVRGARARLDVADLDGAVGGGGEVVGGGWGCGEGDVVGIDAHFGDELGGFWWLGWLLWVVVRELE